MKPEPKLESTDLRGRSATYVDHVADARYPRFETAMLPKETLFYICDFLETEELLISFPEAWPKIGDLINEFNVLRTRELQCFALKKIYMTTKLGV